MKYKNPLLEEKPNHAHYPACLGRLEAINKQGSALFIFSLVSGLLLSVISLTGFPLQVIGWLPVLVGGSTSELSSGMCTFQMLICWGLILLGLFGCGRYKICHYVLFLIYLLMFIVPIFHMFSLLDAFTFIAGGLGVIFGYRAPKNYYDYQQLSETEGFPLFSIILTEHEEQKRLSKYFNNRYGQAQKQSQQANAQTPVNAPAGRPANAPAAPPVSKPASAPVSAPLPAAAPISQETAKHDPTEGVVGMPELEINKNTNLKAAPDRFKPKSGKVGRISDSGLKFR